MGWVWEGEPPSPGGVGQAGGRTWGEGYYRVKPELLVNPRSSGEVVLPPVPKGKQFDFPQNTDQNQRFFLHLGASEVNSRGYPDFQVPGYGVRPWAEVPADWVEERSDHSDSLAYPGDSDRSFFGGESGRSSDSMASPDWQPRDGDSRGGVYRGSDPAWHDPGMGRNGYVGGYEDPWMPKDDADWEGGYPFRPDPFCW